MSPRLSNAFRKGWVALVYKLSEWYCDHNIVGEFRVCCCEKGNDLVYSFLDFQEMRRRVESTRRGKTNFIHTEQSVKVYNMYRLVTYHELLRGLQNLRRSQRFSSRGVVTNLLKAWTRFLCACMQYFPSLTFLLCWEVLWFGQLSCCGLCRSFSFL